MRSVAPLIAPRLTLPAAVSEKAPETAPGSTETALACEKYAPPAPAFTSRVPADVVTGAAPVPISPAGVLRASVLAVRVPPVCLMFPAVAVRLTSSPVPPLVRVMVPLLVAMKSPATVVFNAVIDNAPVLLMNAEPPPVVVDRLDVTVESGFNAEPMPPVPEIKVVEAEVKTFPGAEMSPVPCATSTIFAVPVRLALMLKLELLPAVNLRSLALRTPFTLIPADEVNCSRLPAVLAPRFKTPVWRTTTSAAPPVVALKLELATESGTPMAPNEPEVDENVTLLALSAPEPVTLPVVVWIEMAVNAVNCEPMSIDPVVVCRLTFEALILPDVPSVPDEVASRFPPTVDARIV